MSNSKKMEKNSSSKISLLIALSFAIGFGLATVSAMTIFCPECFGVSDNDGSEESRVFILDDPRLIVNATTPPPGPEEIITPIGNAKLEFLKNLVSDPRIQLALKNSKDRDSKMSEDIRTQIYRIYEKEWTQAQEDTPFMESIINNDVSKFLLNNHVILSEKFGYFSFGEHILTNVYGANVAVSIKTDNYDQSNDDWWQISIRDEEGKPFARDCEFDTSAGIFSEDIVIKITDNETGEFIGILNSATPCNVTKKSVEKETKIVPVSLDNITPKGEIKISYLEDLGENPIIQNALKSSNAEFLGFADKDLMKLKEETDWPIPGTEEPNLLQISILENQVAGLLRQHMLVSSEDYDELQFPEMILTNAKGVNVASTDRTFNYIQNQKEWWQVASQNDVLVRHCGKDISINMSSEDIIIKIYDKSGEFIGILNVATPCDVVLIKPPNFYGDSN